MNRTFAAMINPNPQFELVKNEGKLRETVLCTSSNRFLLIELKNELIKLHNRNKYTVRPILVHIKSNRSLNLFLGGSQKINT